MKQSLVFLTCVLLYACCSTLAATTQKCRKVVDIVMVLDESGSIGRKNWRKVKKFVRHVISRFSVTPFGAHFAAVKYNNRPRKVFSLTKYTNAKKLRKAVRRMRYRGGGTRTGKALRFTNRRILWRKDDRKDVPNVVVLVSDGKSHDHRKAVRVARKMKRKGVTILCVGIGRGRKVDRLIKQLQEISSKPEYTFKTTMNALDTIENSLVKDMCEPIMPPVEPFSKKGCYQTPRPRSATLLFNRRDQIDWKEGWDNFIEKIVHDCGKAAKDGGDKYFCIEFYGECWGYKDFPVSQPHAGANACWGKRPNFNTCDDSQKNPICVGTANHGYIYELN